MSQPNQSTKVKQTISDEPTKSKHENQTIFFKKEIPDRFNIVHNCLWISLYQPVDFPSFDVRSFA
jgi:hypothetical protein